MSYEMLKIATWNAERDRRDQAVVDGVSWIFGHWHPHILALQEARQYVDVLHRFGVMDLALPRNSHFGGDAQNNPILYNPRQLELLDCFNTIEHPGAAGRYPVRILTSAKFRWIGADNSIIWANNTQADSHIEVAGHPRHLPRVELATEMFRDAARHMVIDAHGKSLAFLMGDMNVDEDADNRVDWWGFPNQIFREHGLVSIYDELHTPASFDTHGRRKIDVIASYKGDARVEAELVSRGPRLGSDHNPVLGRYRVRQLAA